jgi:hypothetical protein
LDVEEMESSSNIDLRDVSWWMSIKEACRLGAPIIAKFSKEGCISLITKNRSSHVACCMTETSVAAPQPEKHAISKWVYQK